MVPKNKQKRPDDGLYQAKTSSLSHTMVLCMTTLCEINIWLTSTKEMNHLKNKTFLLFYFHNGNSEDEGTMVLQNIRNHSPNDKVITGRPKPLVTAFLIYNTSECFKKNMPPFHAVMFHQYKNWCINETSTRSPWYSTDIWCSSPCEPQLRHTRDDNFMDGSHVNATLSGSLVTTAWQVMASKNGG